MRYWIGVAAREHVRVGVAGGFAQLGHGKAAALRSVREDPKTLSYLEEEARRRFEPEEGIVDGSGD